MIDIRKTYEMNIKNLEVPTAEHIGRDDLPWAQADENIQLKILQVSQRAGF